MTLPLEGYRVLDLSAVISGPSATVVLADQGAEVIKVEPLHGDVMRVAGPARNGFGAAFMAWNRNKKSIAVDLSKDEGKAVLKRLARDADVLVQNFRPGVMERMGLGPEILRRENPRLIWVAISGFGEDGPYAHRPVYDPIVQGLSSIAYLQAAPSDPQPELVRGPVLDKVSGLVVAQAITAALCQRERDGAAGNVNVAMLDIAVNFAWADVMGPQAFIGEWGASSTIGGGEWLHPTSDGHIIIMPVTDEHFRALSELANRPDWLEDPRFANLRLRTQNMDALGEKFSDGFLYRTTKEWERLLEDADIPYAPVLKPHEVRENPQVVHNQMIVERTHPVAGNVRECRAPARFDGEASPLRESAPVIGEHTDMLLGRVNYTNEEIAALREAGVVGGNAPA